MSHTPLSSSLPKAMGMAHHGESATFRSLTRYEEYYLAGGDLFLLVEHNVFRVHRYFFERESTYFKAKLATPASPGSTRPGTNESNAIVLDDVRVHEFARFLWVFYNPKYSLYNASVADWVAILTLAHRWAFPEVKALAVRELERQHMPDIDRVVVYQDNDVDRHLLIPCYAALCERDAPITFAEGHRMGIETSLTIAHLREMARRSPIDCRSPTPANFRGDDLFSLVRELFKISPPPLDDSVPQTPLGGLIPPPWPLPPQKGIQHLHQPQSTVPTTPPAKKMPASTVSTLLHTPRTVTPPLPAVSITELLTPPQEPTINSNSNTTNPAPPPPTPPPVLPEKPERPQIITGPKTPQGKVNNKPVADLSRPSTPVPTTPTTETPNPEKKTRKKRTVKKQTGTSVATGSVTPKTEEKASVVEVTDEGAQQLKEGEQKEQKEQKEEVKETTEGEKKDAEKKDETTVTVAQESKEAGPSATLEDTSAVPVGESKQTGVEATGNGNSNGNGVSTDTSNPFVDPFQVLMAGADGGGSPVKHESLDKPFSPVGKPKGVVIDRNDLKTPLEKASKSPSLLGGWSWTS